MAIKPAFAARAALAALSSHALAVACASAAASAAPSGTFAPVAPAAVAPGPKQLVRAAEELVAELTPERNVYGSHPTEVLWADPAAGIAARNRSVCSSFLSHLLERVYGLTPERLAALTGKRNPHARDYYQAIVAQRGFARLSTVGEIRRGDVIALSYPPGSGSTGHVMVVAARPELREATAPLLEGTLQYAVTVIDSSHSVHGLTDTRGTPARHGTGAGRGVFRLYADSTGAIVASSWSVLRGSRLDDVRVRKLAAGRITGFQSARTAPPDRGDANADDERPAHEF
jgi:hypothetical protein